MAHRSPNPTLGRHNANDVAVFRRSRHSCPGLARQLGYKVTRIFGTGNLACWKKKVLYEQAEKRQRQERGAADEKARSGAQALLG